MNPTTRVTTALAVIGALAVPGVAAAHESPTLGSVKAHTTRADSALDRAASQHRRGHERRADRSFAKSRREMAAARREAAKLRRSADTASEERTAAKAYLVVAREQDENIEKLTGALDDASGRSERRMASAALSDVRGREKALAVLERLLGEVPEQARSGIANAMARLSQDRDEEVEDLAQALTDSDVSSKSKGRVARALETNVEGQVDAAQRLAELIAGDQVPESGKAGLQKAYDAVTAEHGSVESIIARFSDRMPSRIRSFVEQVVRQARTDGRKMRENRPAPPSGGAQQGGAPEGTTTGAPEGTTSAPEGTPTGAPSGTPTGV